MEPGATLSRPPDRPVALVSVRCLTGEGEKTYNLLECAVAHVTESMTTHIGKHGGGGFGEIPAGECGDWWRRLGGR